MSRSIALVCLMLSLSFLSFDSEAEEKQSEPKVASSKIFSMTRIGYAGSYTTTYKKIWEIKNAPDAEKQYLAMLDAAPADKLYGLVGLKLIKSKKYKACYTKLLADQTLVSYGPGGCMVMDFPVAEIAKQIDKAKLLKPK